MLHKCLYSITTPYCITEVREGAVPQLPSPAVGWGRHDSCVIPPPGPIKLITGSVG